MNGKGAQPPSGKAHARNTGGMNAATAIAMPSRRLVRSPPAASAKATPAMARNSPATGLPSGQSTAKTTASTWRRRWSASSAASPNATPIAKGSRPVNSRVAVPTPNQIAPQRARSAPK